MDESDAPNIEAEIEKIIVAVSKLSGTESYDYEVPSAWRESISRIHIQRPYGLAIWGRNRGVWGVVFPRTRVSPRRMRRILGKVMKYAECVRTAPVKTTEEQHWERQWHKEE